MSFLLTVKYLYVFFCVIIRMLIKCLIGTIKELIECSSSPRLEKKVIFVNRFYITKIYYQVNY